MLRRVVIALVLLACVLVVGTAGFMLIERLPFLDALFMTVITVSTVGFGLVKPLSAAGKLFTVGLIFVGIGAIGFTVGTFLDFLVEGHLTGLLEGRRMEKDIAALSEHHIVAGLGRVGTEIACSLALSGAPFVVIDSCPECREHARGEGWLFILGDATDDSVLQQAGLAKAKSVLAALDSDADNLYLVVSARGSNPGIFIVARATSESSEGKLRKAGADRVITPTAIGGRRMASMALHPLVSDYVDVMGETEQLEFRLRETVVRPGAQCAGRSIRQSQIHDQTGAFVMAVKQATGEVVTNPPADFVIEAGDKLIAFGTDYQLDLLAKCAGQQ